MEELAMVVVLAMAKMLKVAVLMCLWVQVHSSPGSFYYSAPAVNYYHHFPTTYTTAPAAVPTYDYWQPQPQPQVYYVPRFQSRFQPQPLPPQPLPQPQRRTQNVNTRFASPRNNYRGFAYHNRYEGGASSHVVFLTGSESKQVSINLPRFQPRMTISPVRRENLTGIELARTAASDAVDTVASKNSFFPHLPKNSAFESLRNFLESDEEGIQNYYSNNGVLEVRNFADNKHPGFPSSTPLPFVPNPEVINPRYGDSGVETNTVSARAREEEEEAAESIVSNTRLLKNTIIVVKDEDNSGEQLPTRPPASTTASASSTTSTTSTTTSTTTTTTTTTPAPTTTSTTSTPTTTAAPTTTVPSTTYPPSTTTAIPTTTPSRSTMQPIVVDDDMESIVIEARLSSETTTSTTEAATTEAVSVTTENATTETTTNYSFARETTTVQ